MFRHFLSCEEWHLFVAPETQKNEPTDLALVGSANADHPVLSNTNEGHFVLKVSLGKLMPVCFFDLSVVFFFSGLKTRDSGLHCHFINTTF